MEITEFNLLQDRIKKFCKDRDWNQFHDPKNLAISLQLESSEVLELFQWSKDNAVQAGKEEDVADELADVFYWLLMLSNYYNIDLVKALDEKMDKNEAKYPVDKAKGKANKYTTL